MAHSLLEGAGGGYGGWGGGWKVRRICSGAEGGYGGWGEGYRERGGEVGRRRPGGEEGNNTYMYVFDITCTF